LGRGGGVKGLGRAQKGGVTEHSKGKFRRVRGGWGYTQGERITLNKNQRRKIIRIKKKNRGHGRGASLKKGKAREKKI